jgi:CRISPR/Cas system CMR subunit Cmr6 (Cas7 group RAMP superfamily)
MSDQNQDSVQTQASSGSTETLTTDKVAYETYKRVLNEAKKLKEQNKLLEDERNKVHESKLKEQNEWKALAESYQKRLEETSHKLNEQEQSIVNGMKYQEFEKHLGGRLKNKDYATFIDFDKIVMNPETKRVDEESVKGVVSGFVKQHSSLVDFENGARLPNEAAKGSSFGYKDPSKMTATELAEEIKKLGKL